MVYSQSDRVRVSRNALGQSSQVCPSPLRWDSSAAAAGSLWPLLTSNAEVAARLERDCGAEVGHVVLELHQWPNLAPFNATACLSLSADFSGVSPRSQCCEGEQAEAAPSPWRKHLLLAWAAPGDAPGARETGLATPAQTTPQRGTIAASPSAG